MLLEVTCSPQSKETPLGECGGAPDIFVWLKCWLTSQHCAGKSAFISGFNLQNFGYPRIASERVGNINFDGGFGHSERRYFFFA